MQSDKILLRIVAVICAANLGLSAWLLRTVHRSSGPTATQQRFLPSVLSASVRDSLFDQIRKPFNARDYDALYALFARDAQVQMSKADFVASVQKVADSCGTLEDGAYSHYAFLANQGDKNFYNLFYAIRVSNASMAGTKTSLRVTVGVAGDEVAIWGVFLETGS